MLEKFKSNDFEYLFAYTYQITQSMINAPHLKAFEMIGVKLSLPDNIGIWSKLHYLKLEGNDISSYHQD